MLVWKKFSLCTYTTALPTSSWAAASMECYFGADQGCCLHLWLNLSVSFQLHGKGTKRIRTSHGSKRRREAPKSTGEVEDFPTLAGGPVAATVNAAQRTQTKTLPPQAWVMVSLVCTGCNRYSKGKVVAQNIQMLCMMFLVRVGLLGNGKNDTKYCDY